MKLSEKILNLRKQRGMSQEELAENLNVSRQAVSRWEMGSALPDATNILQLSRLFGVTTDYLLNDEYESDRDIPAVKNSGSGASGRVRKIVSLCIAASGLLGNFVIYILSRFIEVMVPRVAYRDGDKIMYTWSSEFTDYSYKYFIREHNLEFLTALFWLLFIGGLIAAFVRKEHLRTALAKLRQFFRRKSA